jgi:GTP-binding protein
LVDWPDLGTVRFVDTAGMRRGGKVRGVEYFSFVRATQAIDASDVVLLVLDARDGFTADDKRIAAKVMDAGRALLIVANKWDLVDERDASFKRLDEELTPFAHAPLIRASAIRGVGVPRIPHVLSELHARWSSRVSTSEVNAVLRRALQERPTPRSSGTLHYATQVSTRPPTFVVFGGAREPGPGYRRYLVYRLRSEFGLAGVPIRLRFRARRR